MVVRVRYGADEADFAPAPAGDDDGDCSEAGTWVEGHRVEICEGTPAPVTGDCGEATLELIRTGEVAQALAVLARTACAEPASDPGVTITADGDGGLTVDAHAAGAIVPTNVALLQLIACLAARVEECCAASQARGNDVPLDLTSHDR